MAGKDTKRVSWKRIGLCLAIIYAAGWLALLLTQHIEVWYFAREKARDPKAAIMPQRLSNTAVAALKGAEVSDFGYVFDLPWKVSTRTGARTVSTLKLENGTEVLLTDLRGLPLGLASIEKDTPAEAAAFRSVYGSLAQGSRFQWTQAELNASPSDVSFWHSTSSNARALTMLMLKDAVVQRAKVIYTVSAGGVHGFQLGDPQQPISPVFLRLFDTNDRELWMILRRAPNGVGFTQEQINAIVASIRPATQ
ncbi:MAG TPA: hypothetical protein VK814_10930 [Acidobacteriaceae bacterium]|jgi:hypothetical protein|nr:hypothetical protein [Acidobacteriaceae bacterium]